MVEILFLSWKEHCLYVSRYLLNGLEEGAFQNQFRMNLSILISPSHPLVGAMELCLTFSPEYSWAVFLIRMAWQTFILQFYGIDQMERLLAVPE